MREKHHLGEVTREREMTLEKNRNRDRENNLRVMIIKQRTKIDRKEKEIKLHRKDKKISSNFYNLNSFMLS